MPLSRHERSNLGDVEQKGRISWMKNRAMMFPYLFFGLLGASAMAQPKNHIGEPLAKVMIEADCTLTEAEAAEGLQRKGYSIGDLQAQVTALLNGRYLGSALDGKWRLENWPPCG